MGLLSKSEGIGAVKATRLGKYALNSWCTGLGNLEYMCKLINDISGMGKEMIVLDSGPGCVVPESVWHW